MKVIRLIIYYIYRIPLFAALAICPSPSCRVRQCHNLIDDPDEWLPTDH
jgi:hypothetical protein